MFAVPAMEMLIVMQIALEMETRPLQRRRLSPHRCLSMFRGPVVSKIARPFATRETHMSPI